MRERLQQLIDTNEFEFLKTMSEEDIWKFAFAILYVFSEHEERTGHWIIYDVHGHKACKCSECDKDVGYPCNDKYCKHCGTRMVESHERSE